MFRWLALCVVLCLGTFVAVSFAVGTDPLTAVSAPFKPATDGGDVTPPPPSISAVGRTPQVLEVAHAGAGLGTPVVVNDARIDVIDRREVPCRHEGQLKFLGVEVPKDKVPASPVECMRLGIASVKICYLAIDVTDKPKTEGCFSFTDRSHRLFRVWDEKEPFPRGSDKVVVFTVERFFRTLRVGDRVERDQLVGLIDPALAQDDLYLKTAKLDAGEAERQASAKTAEEYKQRYEAYIKSPMAVSEEDKRSALLAYERYTYEEITKKAQLQQYDAEVRAAYTGMRFHEIRATTSGVVRSIYKNPGEAVKNLDPVFRIENPERLLVAGLLPVEDARRIQLGDRATVEASLQQSPTAVLQGHLGEVHAVAVSGGPQPLIVSVSEDRTVRVWGRKTGADRWQEEWRALHHAPPRSVACTGPGSKRRLFVTGCADGSVWLWDLDRLRDKPPVELTEGEHEAAHTAHQGPVLAVAFNYDGTICATGGEDRSLALWEVATGKLLNRYPNAHRGPITSLQFAQSGPHLWYQPAAPLLSAGSDGALVFWKIEAGKPPTQLARADHRGGEVTRLSSDGQRVLFDQGKEIRLLGMGDLQLEGVLENVTATSGFTTMALFSPDGKTILTNSAADSRLQLWRTPDLGGRGAELRQFVWKTGAVNCGAFDPAGTFAVTGTKDNQVLVWSMPDAEEVAKRLSARVTLVEQSLDTGSRQVRVWADLDEMPAWVVPGASAKVIILPEAKP